jgi:hypothetical protein
MNRLLLPFRRAATPAITTIQILPQTGSSREWRRKSRRRMGLRRRLGWFFGALFLGLGFLSVPWMLEHDLKAIIVPLTEHLGVAFIVTAFAIVVYETSAHYQDPIRIAAQLRSLRRNAEANALHSVIRTNFRSIGNEHREVLSKAVTTIVLGLKEMEHRGDWAKAVYLQYLGDVLQNAQENADELLGASVRKPMEAARDHCIVLFPPAKRTDAILSDLMSKLTKGSEYNVISDIESWKSSHLERFFSANLRAAKERGVTIRRIFVLDLESSPTEESFLKAHAVISRHIVAGTKSGCWTRKPLLI